MPLMHTFLLDKLEKQIQNVKDLFLTIQNSFKVE